MYYSSWIHPNNPIKWPNFNQLAEKYTYFRDCGRFNSMGKFKINLNNNECKRQLLKVLLEHFFTIKIYLPDDRLVPALTLRVNYICWLEDLLLSNPEVNGIDVGCGASCIYPLLGAMRNGWKFLATEIDEVNFDSALLNVKNNCLTDLINVIKKNSSNDILLDILTENITYHFSMCNPPFHSIEFDDDIKTNGNKEAADIEMKTEGGEVTFIKKMIDESQLIKSQIRIYTTMVGKKFSIKPLIDYLNDNFSQNENDGLITSYCIAQFCQGNIIRWGLAWSYNIKKFPGKQDFWNGNVNLMDPWGRMIFVKYFNA